MKPVVPICMSLSVLLGNFSAGSLAAADAIGKEPVSISHAMEYRNVRYLPDWRYSGDTFTKRDDQGTLLLVEHADREKAKQVITKYFESIKYKGDVRWLYSP